MLLNLNESIKTWKPAFPFSRQGYETKPNSDNKEIAAMILIVSCPQFRQILPCFKVITHCNKVPRRWILFSSVANFMSLVLPSLQKQNSIHLNPHWWKSIPCGSVATIMKILQSWESISHGYSTESYASSPASFASATVILRCTFRSIINLESLMHWLCMSLDKRSQLELSVDSKWKTWASLIRLYNSGCGDQVHSITRIFGSYYKAFLGGG